jgi:hypothetical protein
MSWLGRAVLLRDVLAQDGDGAGPQPVGLLVVTAKIGNSARSLREDTPLSELPRREIAIVDGKFTSRWTCTASPLNSASSTPEVRAHLPHDLLHALQVPRGEPGADTWSLMQNSLTSPTLDALTWGSQDR